LIGGSAAAVSAVVGTSVFATLEKGSSDTWLKIGVGVIAVIAAILTNLAAFLNHAERVEKHRSAGVQYKIIIRKLERLLTDKPKTVAEEVLTTLENELNDLEKSAPVVPEWIYDRIEEEWKKKGFRFVPKADGLYPGHEGQCPCKPVENMSMVPSAAPDRLPRLWTKDASSPWR
jgi:hypothetical protein